MSSASALKSPASAKNAGASPLKSPKSSTKGKTALASPGATQELPVVPLGADGLPLVLSPEGIPIVFRGPTRGKKVFKALDLDADKFLSREEFEEGIQKFLSTSEELALTPAQIDALWKETDLNNDGKISWAEFQYRFCGGVHPYAELEKKMGKKPTLQLQVPKRKEKFAAGGKLSVNDMKFILENLFEGGKQKYKNGVDISMHKELTAPMLKKLLTQIITAEREDAKAQKRDMLEFAAVTFQLGGIAPKDSDRLFNFLDTKKEGKIDLTAIFEQAKLRPAPVVEEKEGEVGPDGKKRSNKKKKVETEIKNPKAHVMATIKAENIRDFISDKILVQLSRLNEDNDESLEYKCHPPLKHWGDDEKKKRGLLEHGYKTNIFLSERTKIKSIVKLDTEVVIFGLFRTEYTAMARSEYLYHARISFDLDEVLQRVDVKLKKSWVDGEIDKFVVDSLFEDWETYVPFEDEMEELSIPPMA